VSRLGVGQTKAAQPPVAADLANRRFLNGSTHIAVSFLAKALTPYPPSG